MGLLNTSFIQFAVRIIISGLLISGLSIAAFAQKWQRQSEPEEVDLMLFHSLFSVNMPTAETLQQGDFHFGLTHRFNTPIKSGWEDLFGIDGSVTMRIEFGYAITDHLLATFGRTNKNGNLDLQFRYKTLQLNDDLFPVLLTLNAGVAYNGKAFPEPSNDSRLWQYFGQAIINAMIDKKIGIGLVPSYLYNSEITCDCDDNQYSFLLGTYAQYYINDMWSLLIEYTPTISGWRNNYDSFSFAVETETGGHFFKIVLGNNIYQNMSQYLSGSISPIKLDNLHIGFNITRTL